MKVDGKPYRTIWPADDGWAVEIIDQTDARDPKMVEKLSAVAGRVLG